MGTFTFDMKSFDQVVTWWGAYIELSLGLITVKNICYALRCSIDMPLGCAVQAMHTHIHHPTCFDLNTIGALCAAHFPWCLTPCSSLQRLCYV